MNLWSTYCLYISCKHIIWLVKILFINHFFCPMLRIFSKFQPLKIHLVCYLTQKKNLIVILSILHYNKWKFEYSGVSNCPLHTMSILSIKIFPPSWSLLRTTCWLDFEKKSTILQLRFRFYLPIKLLRNCILIIF